MTEAFRPSRVWKRELFGDLLFVWCVLVIAALMALVMNLIHPIEAIKSQGGLLDESASPVHGLALDETLLIFQNHQALFVDAREPIFFNAGHIPGAINLPRNASDGIWSLFHARAKEGKNIVVYCSGADCTDAFLVARKLAKAGYQKVAVFSGGWEEWQAAGLPRE